MNGNQGQAMALMVIQSLAQNKTIIQIIIFSIFGLGGLFAWLQSALPLMEKETAINLRKSADTGSSYKLINILNIAIKSYAVFLWIIGLLLILVIQYFAANMGPGMGSM